MNPSDLKCSDCVPFYVESQSLRQHEHTCNNPRVYWACLNLMAIHCTGDTLHLVGISKHLAFRQMASAGPEKKEKTAFQFMCQWPTFIIEMLRFMSSYLLTSLSVFFNIESATITGFILDSGRFLLSKVWSPDWINCGITMRLKASPCLTKHKCLIEDSMDTL